MALRHLGSLCSLLLVAGCISGPDRPQVAESGHYSYSIGVPAVMHVGESAELDVEFYSSPRPIAWRVEEADKERLVLDGWRLVPKAPGGVVLIATSNPNLEPEARSLLAIQAQPAPSVRPVPVPSGIPSQLNQSGYRIIRHESEWTTFLTELGQTSSQVGPIDFEKASLLVVAADKGYNQGEPVVTHVTTGNSPEVSVVYPVVRGYNFPEPEGTLPGWLTLLEVPKLPSNARASVRTLAQGELPVYQP